ncbi:MAG: methyltransferase domain-containing protein [Gammaproteobacteria bacterium]|nr:methyltransferase domain-containing protein [Gammaproteobacteria bacterium]
MTSSATFWNRIARRYAARPVADEAAYQKKLEITRQHLRPDMKLLEIGCGTGSTAIVHASYVKEIDAIDISPRMIEIAEGKAAAANISNINFRCMAIDDLSAPNESFDMVLGLSILHLLENWQAVIAQVHNMLKPGGKFVTSTACIGDIMPLFRLVAPLGRAVGLMPYVSIFSADDLKGSFDSAGFSIDHEWQPGRKASVFIVAGKPDS